MELGLKFWIATFCIHVLLVTALPIKEAELASDEVIVDKPHEISEKSGIVKFDDEEEELRGIRPGMYVGSYEIDIEPDIEEETFEGHLLARVFLSDPDTREDPIKFNVEDLEIEAVYFAIGAGARFMEAEFEVDEEEGLLIIETGVPAISYTLKIDYEGHIRNDGSGIYMGWYDDDRSYLAMNLHPTHARRVFPCLDEPTEATLVSFNFHNEEHSHIVGNSLNEGDADEAEFEAIQGPPHLWGIVAHDFSSINVIGQSLQLYGRVTNQGGYAQMMLQNIFEFLNEWTDKPFDEIDEMQDGSLHIFALPDITRDWYALSTVAIWEPNIFMENDHSVKQQIDSLTAMSQGLARQWFGYVIYPQNWKYAWVTEGLAMYSAYQAAAKSDDGLDFDSIFLTDVIQESMLRDSFSDSQGLEPEDELFEEDEIRDHLNGILRYKAPALFRMLNLALGEENDYIEIASKNLIESRTLQHVSDFHFYDSVHSAMLSLDDNDYHIEDVIEFLEPWIHNTGFPVINVGLRTGGLFITQERFGFTSRDYVLYDIPLTYTTSKNPDFDDVYPDLIIGATHSLNVDLDEDDWIVFNIQGQGYYRVNYHESLWKNLIAVLEDEEERKEIPKLNRATILDDALNLARADQQDYDIALQIALTMEWELEYAPWKTFVRNMNFLKKQLLAYVAEDDDLDPDIYLRMVRRTIITFEEEIGFHPDVHINEDLMITRTRGLVMEHACRSNYEPCIAAAIDWFFDPDADEIEINDEIPHEIRPAVFCAMVREADEYDEEKIKEVLWEKFEEEDSLYERIVILQSFACSHDKDFIDKLLRDTLEEDGVFGVEERALFFEAVAESSIDNAKLALEFIRRNTNDIRDKYGGPDRLERIIHTLAENLVTEDSVDTFETWVDGMNSQLEDSRDSARRAVEKAKENLIWQKAHLEEIYEWIDENSSSTMSISLLMFSIMFILHIFNR